MHIFDDTHFLAEVGHYTFFSVMGFMMQHADGTFARSRIRLLGQLDTHSRPA